MAETQNTKLNSLMNRLRQLKSDRETLNKKEHGILEQINKKGSRELKQESRPTRKELVVTFVKEIEKAKQYYDFSEFLVENSGLMKQDKDEFASFKRLYESGVYNTYAKLDFKDIMEAVEGWWCGCAALNPLTKLVYRMNSGYTLNEDPIYELRKIEEEDYMFYAKIFVWKRLENYTADKVVVRSVPLTWTDDEVKQLLSGCGDVVSVEFDFDDSLATWDKVVYATFKDSVSAKIAPILMKQTYYHVTRLPEPSVWPDVPSSSEYNEALIKYEEFRKPAKFSNKKENADIDIKMSPVKKPKVDPSSTCDGAFARLDDMLLG